MIKPVRVVSTLLAAALVSPFLVAGANYSGLCVPELRYPSDTEKVDAAVSYVLERGWLPHDGQANDPRYKSVEEYLRLVPDCCVVGRDFVGGMDFPYRFLGSLSDFVSIANVPRATAEAASSQELSAILNSLRDNEHYFIAVSNCGRAWDFTD